jgi:hypothetical protein
MAARLLVLLFVLCVSSAAEAQVVWSSPGTGCVPSDATTKFDRSKDGIASVQHAAGALDLIALTCTVLPFAPGSTDWTLQLTYQDSTGAASTAFVRARLYRMPLAGATPVLLATANSNASTATTLHTVSSAVFPYSFDFDTNTYWVRVDMDRAATNQTVVFHSAALIGLIPSDLRLKHDVALLGHLDNGLGFYRFSYNGSDAAYVGVMAQEVEALIPDAVVRGDDGYLRVNYGRLGFAMQSWEDWVAAGEKIPATTAAVRH